MLGLGVSGLRQKKGEDLIISKRDIMNTANIELRPAGKGFVIASAGKGLPEMRRLVESYTGRDKKTYIKLNGQIILLLPSHMFISGN